MFKHLLVPTDGSELSDEAVDGAVLFARESGARITFFYAQPEFAIPFSGQGALIELTAPTLSERYAKAMEAKAGHILRDAKKRAEAAGVEADSDTLVSERPYEAIVEAADRQGCDVIFIASHGRSGIGGLLLGSVTTKVVAHSKIPVLVFR